MKYGETLRQRSILAWAHHNIDYDDVKHFIKENTTPGKGKSVSVPGTGDGKQAEFENALFHILADQHQRINLFVKSKAGEIRRRLDHSRKQLRALSTRRAPTADHRIPVARLERYGRLENDVVKAGDEIRSLARFIATQKTAFRKLLKKYRKWTGSADLEDRFRDDILDDPKSFSNLDLGPLLDEYSATRQNIRTLYESQVQQSAGPKAAGTKPPPTPESSVIKQLQDAVETESRVFFDTSIATVPLGDHGTFASYFVHPDNIIELQVLLLQHARYHMSRSRQNSVSTTPISSEPTTPSFSHPHPDHSDYHMLVADDLARFAKEQSAMTVNDREHLPGSFPQKAKAAVRWADDEDALACLRSRSGKAKSAYVKKKHIPDFFDKQVEFSSKRDIAQADSTERVEELRKELFKDNVRPLFHFSSCRSRLVGLDDNVDGIVLATLDTGICIENASPDIQHRTKSSFPFAILLVRQEGSPKSRLLSILDRSHLVERVRGFSLEYHSVWQTHRPENMSAPFWLPMLSRDIRKLPPPATKRGSINGDVSASGTRSVGSCGSGSGLTLDSTTAVETSGELGFETPPLQSFRKKKRRAYPEAAPPEQKYWNEYDNPEDEDPNAYYIYVDPNQTNAFDKFFDNVSNFLSGRRKNKPVVGGKNEEDQPLLYSTLNTPPSGLMADEESSDDEAGVAVSSTRTRASNFGTFADPTASPSSANLRRPGSTAASRFYPSVPLFTGICFAASFAMLVMAYTLRATGRHKLIGEVHVGVWFSMVCSLVFVVLGFTNVVRMSHGAADGSGGRARIAGPPATNLGTWTVCVLILIVDVVASGALLAWSVG